MRLQLTLGLAAAAVLGAGLARSEGELVGRASTEVSSYADSQYVNTLTPTVAGVVSRPTAGWSVDGRYLADVVSAASVDIISTASPRWTELRHAGSLAGRYKPRTFGGNLGGSFSREPDYLSLGFSGGIEQDLRQRTITVSFGYGFGHDTIGRAGTPYEIFSRTLVRHAFKPAVSFVLDRSSVLSLVGDVILERGDQSKPYRYIPMFSASVAPHVPVGASVDLVNALRTAERPLEQLPLERERFALTARYARRSGALTVRVEERLYADSWGLAATTTDLRPIVDVSRRVSLWTHLRFHLQNAVSFWRRAYVVDGGIPALRTGDRELGALSSVTGGGGLRWAVGRTRPDAWALTAQLDATSTSFYNTLYLTRRLAAFLAIGVEAEL